jgi:hypothetical protein
MLKREFFLCFVHRWSLTAAALFFTVLPCPSHRAFAQAGKPAANADTLLLSNGDTLTGKISKVTYGKVTFHDEVLGDLTIPLNKIRAMHTRTTFAAGASTEPLTKKNEAERVAVGKVSIENETLKVATAEGTERRFPSKDLSFMLEEPAYRRELQNESDFFYGWNGSATLGATLVQATNSSQTYTSSVSLVRAIPTIAGLPAGSKTILNLSGTYGLARNPEIFSGGTIYQAASVTKTDILHGDLEYDKFFTSMVFGLISATADHNYGSGLQLQQAYGAGFGWSILRNPQNDLAVRAALQYEQQQFYDGIYSGLGTPTDNLVGALLNETWNRTLPHNMKLKEAVTLSPTFNLVKSYSGVGSASFVLPLYKRLNVSLTATDNYLGDPPQGFLRNTFQLTTGFTYTLK